MYHIAIAGSSQHTVLMAEVLKQSPLFQISYTLSPTPKLIGRRQILTKNPLQEWSEKEKITHFLVEKRIDQNLRKQLSFDKKIDFLLVVDFGYLIPTWLLQLPAIAPLNIHPSELPKWRGSSPGQFALLFKNLGRETTQTAVTLMVMNEGLDQGPIVAQLPFTIEENWTQTEYYHQAFSLMAKQLAKLIDQLAQGKITPQAQTLESPTMIARRLRKEDGFVSWSSLNILMEKPNTQITSVQEFAHERLLDNLLIDRELCKNKSDQLQLVSNAALALNPWPNLWTEIVTSHGQQRMKILSCHVSDQQLILDQVQIEGKNPCLFRECKNALL